MVSNDFEPLAAIVSHGESEVLEWKSATATRNEVVQTFVSKEQQRMVLARLPVGADAPGAERKKRRAEVRTVPEE